MNDAHGVRIIHGLSMKAIGRSGEQFKLADSLRHVKIHRFADRLAVVQRFERCVMLMLCLKPPGDLYQNILTLSGRAFRPLRESAFSGSNCAFDILCIAGLDLGKDLSGCRVD